MSAGAQDRQSPLIDAIINLIGLVVDLSATLMDERKGRPSGVNELASKLEDALKERDVARGALRDEISAHRETLEKWGAERKGHDETLEQLEEAHHQALREQHEAKSYWRKRCDRLREVLRGYGITPPEDG